MSDAIATRPTSALDTLLSDPERLSAVPIETVERLYAIHQKEAERNDKGAFSEAFRKVQSRMTPVHKAAQGAHGSKYAKAETIHAMLAPLIHEEGFSWSSSMADCPLERHARIVLTIRHGPHVETHFYDAPIETSNRGMSALHSSRSTWTYCERTLLTKVFGVRETEDDDGNAGGTVGPGSEPITEDQVADLNAKIEELHASKRKFLALLKVDALEDLPAIEFKNAVSLLERYGSQA